MHFHCEIVIPPTTDIEAAVTQVLKPFDENLSSDDVDRSSGAFWDWYQIGGRWAGHKRMAKYDPAKVEQFHRWMQEEKLTVSGLVWGKQELSPADQIPKVDQMWAEFFPDERGKPCPIFQHSNPRNHGALDGDVMRFDEIPNDLTCSRIIFAGPHWDKEDHPEDLEAKFMLTEDLWNGVNYMKSNWDCTLKSAVEQYGNNYKSKNGELMPKHDWLVVTVDYHS
jgi:hypothetical protein